MEFTKENWENAPEGARLEWRHPATVWKEVHFVGTILAGAPVIQEGDSIRTVTEAYLRIVLPKRKVTVQLWRTNSLGLWVGIYEMEPPVPQSWTLLGEHIFEIEGQS